MEDNKSSTNLLSWKFEYIFLKLKECRKNKDLIKILEKESEVEGDRRRKR